MRKLYTFLLYFLFPLILLRLLIKSRHLPSYRYRMKERLALGLPTNSHVDVWIHAVSFGEVNAAAPLVNRLLDEGYRIIFTTMTPTGSEQVNRLFGKRVLHQYIPYDLPLFIKRFIKAYSPQLLLIMETELWPNLIYGAKKQQVPVIILNGRISDNAFQQYRRFKRFFKPLLAKLTKVLAQSLLDADRFQSLGVNQSRVFVTGNLKFDLSLNHVESEYTQGLSSKWGHNRPVLLAASTHHDEETQILNQLNRLKKEIPNILLVIAPRHPERFDVVYQISRNMGLVTACKSRPETINEQCDVVILDTLGELKSFFSQCDFAFVGGSLVPVGGHNVLEPMMQHVPVFTGPYMQNLKSVVRELQAHQAITVGEDIEKMMNTLVDFYHHPEKIKAQVQQANRVLQENQGSMENHWEHIHPYLK